MSRAPGGRAASEASDPSRPRCAPTVYTDNNHLTVTYAKTLGPYLLKAMAKEGVDLR